MKKRISVYCKAYRLADLRRFEGWSDAIVKDAGGQVLGPDTAVFVHDDYGVTLSIVVGGDALPVDPGWRSWCDDVLGFAVPPELADMTADVADGPAHD
ncbi:ankyrin-like domain protein [Xanthomonas citri pv. mangiferaeindicae LMG 941]|uniref:hypothetical protein n=1 Tax=Xanthomonas citri TaxID=346 RepID=UPI0002552AE5|nr:hypothetical protein [Xanthomonas citri]CCG36480.1 ankyrin-like domain protein [Xanthomonas citri pv. mangiferaeindicae LMG 941]